MVGLTISPRLYVTSLLWKIFGFCLVALGISQLFAGHVFAAKRFKAVTTFTVLADIVQNVAGEAAVVEAIIRPGADVHNYQPTPKDIIRAQGADVIFWNGLNLERWFKRFFQDVKNVPGVVVSKGVEPMDIYEGAYSGKPNPHAWMSIANGLIYVANVSDAFQLYDPANSDIYYKNAVEYSAKLQLLKSRLTAALADIPKTQRFLVTSEGAFSYFTRDFDLQEVYLWPINADQQGSPKQVREVIKKIRQHNIPVVFSESTVSDKPAKQLAKETGAIYGGVLYVDSLSVKQGAVPSYLDMLQVNVNTIVQGFRKALHQK